MSLGACNLLTCPAVVISKELYIFHVQQVVLIRFVTQSNLNFRICCLPTNLHQIAQNYTRTEQWSEKKQSTGADGIVALVFSTQSGSARDNCLLSNELLTAKRLPIVNDISSSTSLLGFFATNNNFSDIWSSTDCWEWLGDHDGAAVVGGEEGWQMEAEVGQPWKTNTGQPAGCGKLLYFLSLAKCISLSLSKVFVWKAQPAGSVVVVTQSAHLLLTSPPRHRYHITPSHWITRPRWKREIFFMNVNIWW